MIIIIMTAMIVIMIIVILPFKNSLIGDLPGLEAFTKSCSIKHQ